jgi:hypothetical protein
MHSAPHRLENPDSDKKDAHFCLDIQITISRMSALFEARATKERVLHFRECAEYVFSRFAFAKVSIELIAIYFHSFEMFNIQTGEMTFCKPDFIIIKSNYF